MCGFTGFWQPSIATTANLAAIATAMAEVIASRGPDSNGTWCDPQLGIAFAHRRLSVVDLSVHGHQPMISASGRFVISYNGEVYNANDIKQELMQRGIRQFCGHSDTEIIVAAIEEFGVQNAIIKLNGMFAFALWDRKYQQLYLVRDRLGIKPLYWGINNGILFFGSQLNSFLQHPNWRGKLNSAALAAYFKYNYVPAPLAIFAEIYKLKPAHLLKIDAKFAVTEICYWDFNNIVQQGVANREPTISKINTDVNTNNTDVQHYATAIAQHTEQLNELLRDSVKRMMLADVPIGAFLSGGIDSSTVAALMQAQSSKPIKTFSIGFFEQGYNEAQHAHAVAKHLGTDHHELYVTEPQAQELVPELANWYDEPFADSSQIPTYLISRLARQQVTVGLSGDGGDELFAGYNRYLLGDKLWPKLNLLPQWLRSLAASGIERVSPAILDQLARWLPILRSKRLLGDKAHKFAKVLRAGTDQQFYDQLVSQWGDPTRLISGLTNLVNLDQYTATTANSLVGRLIDKIPFIDWMQYIDTISYLPDDILTKVDRASMAVSLEVRVPLLDHRVAEFAWQLPHHLKVAVNSRGQILSKWLLRQVLYKYVPANLVERPKMGFGVPIEHWLRGELRDWAEDLLSSGKLVNNGLEPSLIRQKWQEHLSGRRNWQHALWGVLMYQQWYARWM